MLQCKTLKVNLCNTQEREKKEATIRGSLTRKMAPSPRSYLLVLVECGGNVESFIAA